MTDVEEWDALAAAFGTLGRLHREPPDADMLDAISGLLDEWPLPDTEEARLAAERGLLERSDPLVWNLTESEHVDGRSRFHILKGGCAPLAAPSDWYVESGPMLPSRSVKLLQCGAGLNRSGLIGFRCAVDL